MIIYHGHPSPNSIEQAREAAPSHTHGAEWSHQKMTPHDWPYILDNGAYQAWKKGWPWDATAFLNRLLEIETKMPRPPDFVVLPDVVTDSQATLERSETWAELLDRLGLPMALAIQDGMTPGHVAKAIAEWEIDAIFVGGTIEWKRRNAETFGNTAEQFDLQFHIGRPTDVKWAKEIGADSVDTTSIVHNGTFHKLEALEEQTTLVQTDGAGNSRSQGTDS